jgi:hypothetical protein
VGVFYEINQVIQNHHRVKGVIGGKLSNIMLSIKFNSRLFNDDPKQIPRRVRKPKFFQDILPALLAEPSSRFTGIYPGHLFYIDLLII